MAGKSTYTQEIAHFICGELVNGKTLAQVIEEKGMKGVPGNYQTIYNWMDENPTFLEAYMRARERQAHTFADEIVYLGDKAVKDDKIAADKLRLQMDARKWHASKMCPTIFGEPVLLKNRIARQEEAEYIREMKNVTPADDHNDKVPTDPKQIARILNFIMTKNLIKQREQEKDDEK